MRKLLYALVDCSAFYCSCERTFSANLDGKPIVVLSNNDGCIISLTPNAKEKGFKMGTPYYQAAKDLKKAGVEVFSSNYCLYDDMSRRVAQVISKYSDTVEQYSIDEAFLGFSADNNDVESERHRLTNIAREIHLDVLATTGIPVRVSIGETKTLAKIGSEFTKHLLKAGKIPAVCFWNHPQRELFMQSIKVRDVWGVGSKWSKKLESMGVRTAKQLQLSDPLAMRKNFNVVMEKTIRELNNVSCISLKDVADIRKSLVRSRMFSSKINDPHLIRQAVNTHLSRAAAKLRKDGLMARELAVFITTGRHAAIYTQVYRTRLLLRPTNDTFVLAKIANELFDECYRKQDGHGNLFKYSKAGVALSNFTTIDTFSQPLIDPGYREKPALLQTVDRLNNRFGKYTLVTAAMGIPDKLKGVEAAASNAIEWGMKRDMMSPRYTTEWDELLHVRLA